MFIRKGIKKDRELPVQLLLQSLSIWCTKVGKGLFEDAVQFLEPLGCSQVPSDESPPHFRPITQVRRAL